MSMSRKKRARLIRAMRAAHIAEAMGAKRASKAIKAAIVSAYTGINVPKYERPRQPRAPKKLRHEVSEAWANRSYKARKNCKHIKTRKLDKQWRQCKRCGWCVPRLGREPKFIRLPSILAGRELPALREDGRRVDIKGHMSYAGIALADYVRARVVQYTFKEEPFIDRISIEVRFKDGWKCIATCRETEWYKVLPILQSTRKPKKLFFAVQRKLGLQWPEVWMKPMWKRKGTFRVWYDKKMWCTVRNGTCTYSRSK